MINFYENEIIKKIDCKNEFYLVIFYEHEVYKKIDYKIEGLTMYFSICNIITKLIPEMHNSDLYDFVSSKLKWKKNDGT